MKMTSEVERIKDQLRRAVEGNAWHGDALFQLLEGVTPDEAAARIAGPHTIWEIIAHIAAWMSVSRRRVQGSAVLPSPEEDWPASGATDAAAWMALRRNLEQEYGQLLAAVQLLKDPALASIVPGKDYSVYFLLHGVIQHTLYHAGQIAMARKVLKTADGESRDLLRHTLATLAYRGGTTLRGAPEPFGDFRAGETGRTPRQILAHIGDLLEWALVTAQGHPSWHDSAPLPWNDEIDRFYKELQSFEAYLASGSPLSVSAEKLFQGPVADALTHVGQIAMLRRLAGVPMRGENYLMAEITAGRVGPDQAVPRREFD
jgi:uncharacterized damage-inducible protein DinB